MLSVSLPSTEKKSSKDSDETRNMSTKSDNIEIMMGDKTNDIIEELFKSLL